MNIADLINQKQIEYIAEKGCEPKFAYLGKVEMDSLLSWAQKTFGHNQKYKSDSGINFLGLKVFEVNTEKHFNIA